MQIRSAITIAAIASCVGLAVVEAHANPQYYSGTGHYYEIVSDVVAWTSAYDAAASRTWMGSTGHLATITSAGENEFLKSLPWSDLTSQYPSSHGAYVGGTLADGSWQWVTGETWGYTNWYTGQPNGGASTPRLHYYNQRDAATYPDRFGTWNDMWEVNPTGSGTASLGYIVEYENAALLPQVCYLDFSGYTAPAGYGAAEQIAAQVKASVAAKYSQQDLTFMTSFDGSSPNPNITSTIHIGGTNASATVLGSAAYDPGNSNRSDTGYVYSDQAIFGSLPTDSMEYKNMLANTTAHEVGHLLGYSHADAAGMPFMQSGDAMEARIRQDMVVGELGQLTQQRRTYVADTDLDLNQINPQLVYIPKESVAPEQFDAMLEELEQTYGYSSSLASRFPDVQDIYTGSMDLTDLFLTITGNASPFASTIVLKPAQQLTDGLLNILPLSEVARDSMRGHLGGGPSALDLDQEMANLAIEWDESLGGYKLLLTQSLLDDYADGTFDFSFLSDLPGTNAIAFEILDSSGALAGEGFITSANVPEPATLGLLVVGGIALLSRRRRHQCQ